MSLERAAQEQDIAVARQVMENTGLLPELTGYDIVAGVDSSGDPAIWIALMVRPENLDLPSGPRVKALTKYVSELQQKLLLAGVRSWPYLRLREHSL